MSERGKAVGKIKFPSGDMISEDNYFYCMKY